jgi:hypothetical protein
LRKWHSVLNRCFGGNGEVAMTRPFKLDQHSYDSDHLPDVAREIYEGLIFTSKMVKELEARQALFLRAKNGYIEDIKNEVVQKKSGVDLGSLFSED